MDALAARSSSESGRERLSGYSRSVAETIAKLAMESQSPRDALPRALKCYEHQAKMRVGGIASRATSAVLGKVYRGGRSAKVEVQEWLRGKGLAKAPIANEVLSWRRCWTQRWLAVTSKASSIRGAAS